MQIGFIGDIHGNLPALEAVLADLIRTGVDEIWCHGDICYGGPWPRQCAEAVRSACRTTIRGNGDDLITTSGDTTAIAQHDRIKVGSEVLGWIAGLAVEHGDRGLILTHATRRSNKDRLPDLEAGDAAWISAYAPLPATVICGHSHVAFTKVIGRDLRVFNTGSVGGPFDGDPRASYLVGTLDGDSWSFRHGRSDYDREATAQAFEDLQHFEGARFAHAIRTGRHP